jgi:AcrR family transcriptional regulator
MRADAARNLDAVLQTGAQLLARDPGASIAAIAARAGVDRSTVDRRFASREALLAAVRQAKLDAVQQVFDQARLAEAPVTVALHRYIEGTIAVSRQWPVDVARLREDPAAAVRVTELTGRLDAFLDRAVREGLLRLGLPPGWARSVLIRLIDVAAHEQPTLAPGPLADLVVESLLSGLGPR